MKKILSVRETAEVFNVSEYTVREWCRTGILEANKPVGTKSWRIPRESVEKLAQIQFGD